MPAVLSWFWSAGPCAYTSCDKSSAPDNMSHPRSIPSVDIQLDRTISIGITSLFWLSSCHGVALAARTHLSTSNQCSGSNLVSISQGYVIVAFFSCIISSQITHKLLIATRSLKAGNNRPSVMKPHFDWLAKANYEGNLLLFVNTHSDADSGDLVVAGNQNDPVSVPIYEVRGCV